MMNFDAFVERKRQERERDIAVVVEFKNMKEAEIHGEK